MTTAALTAARPAVKRAPAVPAKYTVKAGDTLSGIAKRVYGNPNDWPALYWANHSQVRYANEIQVGQVLKVPAKPAKVPAPPAVLGPAPAPAPAPVAEQAAPAGPATDAPAASSAVTSVAPSAPRQAAATVSAAGGSFQACVIARESGGNSQVMNASGHYGLYQFSASTWAAYGGNPAAFGNASVAQQNQVFNNAIAAGGQSNWSAYDGC